MALQNDHRNTFAASWNARCNNQPFDTAKSADWQRGWSDANRTDNAGRVPFNTRKAVAHA